MPIPIVAWVMLVIFPNGATTAYDFNSMDGCRATKRVIEEAFKIDANVPGARAECIPIFDKEPE